MIYRKNGLKELDRDLFSNPSVEYRAIPFWSWNCLVTKKLIDTQLDFFKEMGFGGVDIHPRTGLETVYLSDEYLELIQYAVKKCKEKGLICWLYDDDRFPSGCADGRVTCNQNFRGRFLLLTETRRKKEDGFCEKEEQFAYAIKNGEKRNGYYITAYALNFQKGYLKAYRRLNTEQEIKHALENGEKVRYLYVQLMPEEAWFQGHAYVDTMNPDAIAEFIRVTHEAYWEKVGEYFGTTVPAIFTDEPRMGKHKQISYAVSAEDVTLPYTDYFAQVIQQETGIQPLDVIPEYIWDMADGKFSVNRYHYRNLTAECFVRAFMDQIGQWCQMHKIAFTGHVLSEDTLGAQVFALGDCMRCYRSIDLPGIDVLCDNRELLTVKQAVSVTRQFGRAGTVSELYGVTHWDCDFKTFKLQGDWQAALGITIRVPHLSHMSLKGEAKRDWPGSIFYQAPWYKEFSYIEDHFARLNTVLTRGKAKVNIGVIHPVESMWLYMGPDDQTSMIRKDIDEDFQEFVRWMLYGTLDFDLLSESLLMEQCEKYMRKPTEKLSVGEMQYSIVIVPNMTTIRSTTLDVLEKFHENGGQIVFMERVPECVDAVHSDRADKLAAKSIFIKKDRMQLYQTLEPWREIAIFKEDGTRSDNLVYQLRQDFSCRWLFVSHVNPKNVYTSSVENYLIKIAGCCRIKKYDTITGEVSDVKSFSDGNNTYVFCGLYAQDSILYQLIEDAKDSSFVRFLEEKRNIWEYKSEFQRKEYETVFWMENAEIWKRSEPNVLLLDYAEYQLDDGEICQKEEILRIDNRLRRQLGYVVKEERMYQPYCMKKRETHKVNLYYHFISEIETSALLAMEDSDTVRIWLNGKEVEKKKVGYYVDWSIETISGLDVCCGRNELLVQYEYHQKTNLENLYILGDFDVELRGNKAVIVEKHKDLTIGDISRQGMPFYTGNLEYFFSFEIENDEAEYYVHIPHFCAPLLGIAVDGEKKGKIAYAPHRLNIGKLRKGLHNLTVCVYGNRYNGFGTLHNANDCYQWYGPNSFRTTGDDWTDDYRIKSVGIMSKIEIQVEK